MTDPNMESFELVAALATDAHRTGDLDAAETCWRQALALMPDHAGARHNLGVLLAQKGEAEAAIAEFDQVLAAFPEHARAHANRAGALRALGDMDGALAGYDAAIECDPDFLQAYSARGDALFRWGRYDEAVQGYDEALAREPNFYPALKDRALAALALGEETAALDAFQRTQSLRAEFELPPEEISLLKLRHDRDQLRWLGRFEEDAEVLDQLETVIQWPDDENETVPLEDMWPDILAPFFNQPVHIAPAERVSKALSDDAVRMLDAADDSTGVRVIDGLLCEEALERLRRSVLESTIWNDFTHIDGFVATYLENGLASPLMLQIVGALRETAAFRGLPLVQGWAFKGMTSAGRIGMHADDAKLSVNFWITPDDANLEPEHGGLIIHRALPPEGWSLKNYDEDRGEIERWIAENDTDPVEIPYRANRAVIFDSRLFHGSGPVRFADGYENRRINITLLFGYPQIEPDDV